MPFAMERYPNRVISPRQLNSQTGWLIAMAILVDSRIELANGEVQDGLSWGHSEALLQSVSEGEPPRLYNGFSRDYGDGYTARDDLPEDHARILDEVREALKSAEGVVSLGPKTTD